MSESLIIAAALGGFAVLHSVLASDTAKGAAVRILGDGAVRAYYRLVYCLLSLVTAGAAALVIGRLPDVSFMDLPRRWQWILWALQAGSLLLAASGFRVFSAGEFLGLSQLRRRLAEGEVTGDIEGLSGQPLQRRGVYRLVRHPMYAAGIAFFLFSPAWTRTWVLVRFAGILYFVAGALLEEKRLEVLYGESYRRYMREVPRFVPRLSLRGG